ncbi:catechol 2,3-dioxygenase-like lactoylglutathione lyase family enzyme [Streptomyces olivoverticillatus]|uniref:Catechol 2,3-dioxygenase-like lactoylglutathione lyase family enzyme n=1 Tax=Streptomyces olivoverticillatus TaxID=66427 RepID=A0A7W7PLZ9_9ACTN|nr:catechol 2,3-dioxygenase-like lactoylglutathione lyase family enzyme [Streptomyces olivoverticillatus]
MPVDGRAHVRIARPSRDLAAAERFWTRGLGLSVLFRKEAEEGAPPEEAHSLLMVGWPDASWHLELVTAAGPFPQPAPTVEDLLVVYTAGEVPEELLARLEEHGGKRVPAHNPYWDTWGVTVEDPDGYRLVLSTREWSNEQALAKR